MRNIKFALPPTRKKKQRESVEYRLRWVPNANFSHWPCSFHDFCVDFICVGFPTQTRFQWSMDFRMSSFSHNTISLSFAQKLKVTFLLICIDQTSIILRWGRRITNITITFWCLRKLFLQCFSYRQSS